MNMKVSDGMRACLFSWRYFVASGLIQLDSISFPKIVPNLSKYVIVGFFKKEHIGTGKTVDNYRDNYLEFAIEGAREGDMDEIICAQVIVNGIAYL